MNKNCCLCGSSFLSFNGAVGKKIGSVLSDARLISETSRVYHCDECGHWQKSHTDEDWKVIGKIYSDYRGHQLSGGNEQLVFPVGLPPRARSFHALEQCLPFLPENGKMLDFGCGDGAVLKSASQLLKGWDLDAYDISDHYEEKLLSIPGVKHFFSKKSEPLPLNTYDLVVLWHTLEHVPKPTEELKGLRQYVHAKGKLLIQVPDVVRNPFDLGVFDHVSHFKRDRLVECAQRAGWKLIADGWDWTHNCLTILLEIDIEKNNSVPASKSENLLVRLNERIERYCKAVDQQKYLIWGTGMASLLILNHLPHLPICFIDEDQDRHGGSVQEIPILGPNTPTDAAVVILPFPEKTAKNICERARSKYSHYNQVAWVE